MVFSSHLRQSPFSSRRVRSLFPLPFRKHSNGATTAPKFSTIQAYLDHFQIMLDVVLHCKATVSVHPGIEDLVLAERKTTCDTMSNKELAKVKAEVFARSTAIAFLTGCNPGGYGVLLDDLENNFLQGDNCYPRTGVAAYNLVSNWKQENCFFHGPSANGVAFPNNNRDFKHITCHKRHKKGHYATNCPELGSKGSDNKIKRKPELCSSCPQSPMVILMTRTNTSSFCLMEPKGSPRTKSGRIVVFRSPGSYSTINLQLTFFNAKLLKNVRTDNGSMMINYCNAGVATTNQIGHCLVSSKRNCKHSLSCPACKEMQVQTNDLQQQGWKSLHCSQERRHKPRDQGIRPWSLLF